MINHSYLLLGPPPSKFAWLSYYTTIAYHVGDELMSLAGLEHCVLRAAMSAPASLIGGLIIPTSRYACALTHAEPRLNFNLNCGSLGALPHVPLYTAERIDGQLDAISRRFLSERVALAADGRTVTLPAVLQLFARDFGHKGAKATPAEYVRHAAAHLDDEALRARLLTLIGDPAPAAAAAAAASSSASASAPSVKFAPFEFRCRTLALISDEELGLE